MSVMNGDYKYMCLARAVKTKRDITDKMNDMLTEKQPIVLQKWIHKQQFYTKSIQSDTINSIIE